MGGGLVKTMELLRLKKRLPPTASEKQHGVDIWRFCEVSPQLKWLSLDGLVCINIGHSGLLAPHWQMAQSRAINWQLSLCRSISYVATHLGVDLVEVLVFGDGVIDLLLHVGDMLLVGDVAGRLSRDLDAPRSGQGHQVHPCGGLSTRGRSRHAILFSNVQYHFFFFF